MKHKIFRQIAESVFFQAFLRLMVMYRFCLLKINDLTSKHVLQQLILGPSVDDIVCTDQFSSFSHIPHQRFIDSLRRINIGRKLGTIGDDQNDRINFLQIFSERISTGSLMISIK